MVGYLIEYLKTICEEMNIKFNKNIKITFKQMTKELDNSDKQEYSKRCFLYFALFLKEYNETEEIDDDEINAFYKKLLAIDSYASKYFYLELINNIKKDDSITYKKELIDFNAFIKVINNNDNFRYIYLSALVNYFSKKENPSFSDYEDFIEFTFIAAQNMKRKDFKEEEVYAKFINIILYGISYAGEGEYGRSFKGCSKIKAFSKYLTQEILTDIIENGYYHKEYQIYYYIEKKNLFYLIDNSNMDKKTKSIYKYYYFDLYSIKEHIRRGLYDRVSSIEPYSNYKHVYDDAKIIENKEIIFYKKASNGGKYIKAEIDKSFKEKSLVVKVEENNKILFKATVFYAPNENINESKILVKLQDAELHLDFDYYRYTGSIISERGQDIIKSILENANNVLTGKEIADHERFELLYLWVEDLNGVIKNKSILFSKQFKYTVEYESDLKITVDMDDDYISTEDMFYIEDNSTVRNINALVGRNGSGKTSIVNLLMNTEVFGAVHYGKNTPQYCIVFKEGRNFYWVSNKENIEVTSLSEIEFTRFGNKNRNKYDFILDTNVVFFSNIVNINKKLPLPLNVTEKSRIDISSQYIHENEMTSQFSRDYNLDAKRVLNFLLFNKESEILQIRAIEFIYLKVLSIDEMKAQLMNLVFKNNFNSVYSLDKIYKRILNEKNILKAIESMDEEFSDFEHTIMYNFILNFKYLKFSKINVKNNYDEILKAIEHEELIKEEYTLKDAAKIVFYLIEYLRENIIYITDEEESIDLGIRSGNSAKININSELSIKNIRVINLYLKSLYNQLNFFVYQLPALSSGEMARLNLFSRVHWVFHKEEGFEELGQEFTTDKKNFILIFDELEAFFHPEWQRSLIYDLLKFFEIEKSRYNSFNNIHVILSSNSPFFISDLPKDHLIYLGGKYNEENGTFAQNIHAIMTDSFFMKNGLMGKFANYKIVSVMKYLDEKINGKENNGHKDTEYETKYKYEIEMLIKIVSEPIIKNSIKNLYQEAFPNDSKLSEINRLENEIERLTKLKEQLRKLR